MSIVTRFAPSPTGFLHLGHAYSAFCAWTRAHRANGLLHLRLEDIDAGRCRAAFADAIIEDLAWLGLDWDGAVRVQSEHLAAYRVALESLDARGLLYPCFCSRAEIAKAQAAPHGAEQNYPGTCRGLGVAERAARIAQGAAYALRLDTARAVQQAGAMRFFDEAAGWVAAAPGRLGDVVLGRKQVATSYHLCVVHDDAVQGVSHVIRGEDLREATHIHVLLQTLLRLPVPVYRFHRLITDAAGRRLAKRDNAATLRAMREAGVSAATVLEQLGTMV